MEQQSAYAQKLPPQSLEMERGVLGAILLENEALVRVLEVLGDQDFYREAHRSIFRTMIELFEENTPIDLLTVTERLRKKEQLEAVGGALYLTDLVEAVPTAANVWHHARVVRDKAVLRGLIQKATSIVSESYEDTEDIDTLLDRAEQSIFEISQRKSTTGFVNINVVLKESFRHIERLYERKELITGVPTGFTKIDSLTAGLQPADLIVIAGRPSMGKTALGLNIAQHVGIHVRRPVALFSLEMAREQLVMRMLCSEARIDSSKLRTGFLSREDWPRLTKAAGALSEAQIYIDDTPAQSSLDIRAKARRLRAELNDLALIIVDYLQLMRGRSRVESRQQEISEITRSLKALAKELQVPVVALSQLSRAVEQRQQHRPQLSDLRESGAIEQDADVVALIYRDEVYDEESEEKGTAEIIIGKQRNGPTGTVRLQFHGDYTRFGNLEERDL